MNLQPLDIIVTRDWTPISWYIRWRSASPWSHVLTAGEEGFLGYTTTWKGFAAVRLDHYLNGKTWAAYRYTPPLKPIQIEAGLDICHRLMGNAYDYTGLLTMELEAIKGKGVFKDGTKKRKCSETVMYLYRQIGAPLLKNTFKQDGGVTPGDIPNDCALTLVGTNDKELRKCLGKDYCQL